MCTKLLKQLGDSATYYFYEVRYAIPPMPGYSVWLTPPTRQGAASTMLATSYYSLLDFRHHLIRLQVDVKVVPGHICVQVNVMRHWEAQRDGKNGVPNALHDGRVLDV